MVMRRPNGNGGFSAVPIQGFGCDTALVRHANVAGFDITEHDYRTAVHRGWHAHNLFGVCLAISGSACDTLRNREEHPTPGEVSFEPPDVPHRSITGPFRVLAVHWSPGTCELDDRLPQGSARYGPVDGLVLRPMMRRIQQELHSSDSAAPIALHALVLGLVAHLGRLRCCSMDRHRPQWVNRAEEFLRGSFQHSISLADVAAELDMSPAHVARSFHAHTGHTVGDYIRSLRIAQAADELVDGELPVVEIALRAGFHDQAAFSRAFKAATGRTPREFRSLRTNIKPRTMRNT